MQRYVEYAKYILIFLPLFINSVYIILECNKIFIQNNFERENILTKFKTLTKTLTKIINIEVILILILIMVFRKNVFFIITSIAVILFIIIIYIILYKTYKFYITMEEESIDEQKMVKSIEGMQDTTASEILTPRTSLYTIDGKTTISQNWDEILEQEFSRIPVYIDNIDNIVGVLFLKDILRQKNKDILVEKIVRKPYFIPGTKKIGDILSEFRKTQNHIAIVIDEYGGTEGIVTIEDILEEIVGEIRDEYDVEEEKIIHINKNIYELAGDQLIEDVNEELNINIPISEEYDTLSGYFLYELGKIAQKNDTIKTDGYIMKVLKTDNVKIEKIKIILLEANNG